MTRRGDILLFAGLLVLLLGIALIAVAGGTTGGGQDTLQGSSVSAAPGGTLALYRWLTDAGYPVRRLMGTERWADALRDTDLLLILNPQSNFTPDQLAALDRWLDAGGVLVATVEGTGGALNPLTSRLGAGLSPLLPAVVGSFVPHEPLWSAPPVHQVAVQAGWQLDLHGTGATTLVSAGAGPLLVVQAHGAGRVVLLSTTYPFTNAGLPAADNRWLAWNLVGSAAGRRIAFDELHHGYTGDDLRTLLTSRPWGWALIYAGGVAVLGLLLIGRRLGPPLPLPTVGARRGAADYVAALAGLFGRAERTDWVADHYRADLRRALAAPYGLPADLPAGDLAAAFAAAHHRPVDAAALATLLADLDHAASPNPRGRPVLGAAALLRLVRQAETLRSDILRGDQ